MNNLYRTSRFNYSRYAEDGFGRDRYIAYNNGGFLKNKLTSSNDGKNTGTTFNTKIEYNYKSPSIKCPNFHYHSDGNGRDTYILVNGGGLYYQSKPLCSYKLTDFLRSTNPGRRNCRSFLSKAEAKYNKLLRSVEKGIVNRLYEKEKKKFIKKKIFNEESGEMRFNTEANNTMEGNTNLNEENENSGYINTMPSVLPKIEKEKKPYLRDNLRNKQNKQNKIVKSQVFDMETVNNRLFEDIHKINKNENKKIFKKINKTFMQYYFHLRNANNQNK